MKITIGRFAGIAPKITPAMLPDFAGQIASNLRLTSGSLRALNAPKLESTNIVAGAKSVYMLGNAGSAIPLSWAADVDVAASPVSDSEFRVYYTGDGLPKKTSLALASSGGGPYPTGAYLMGTPAPTATPSLAATTGSVPAATYVYVFTYVTQFGSVLLEESAPSPYATITLGATGGVALTGLNGPTSTAGRNYVYKRIYRSTGGAYQMVAQIPFANTSYTDTLAPTAIPGDVLATAEWSPPPDDLQGLVALPSGSMAGFRDNEVWFSEPGYPHAWPVKYMQTFDSKVVGIKAFGNNLAVTTVGYPYMGSGVHPESFTFQKLPFMEPCVSKRSMAADEFGTIYASANGFVSIGFDANGVISREYMTRDDFSKFAPDTMTGVIYERRYYGFYDSSIFGSGGVVFARNEEAPLGTLDFVATAATIESKTARMLYVDKFDNNLYHFSPLEALPLTYRWKSKLYYANAVTNLGCFRVRGREDSDADLIYQAQVDAQNATISSSNATVFSSGNLMSAVNESAFNEIAGVNGSAMQPLIPAVSSKVGVTFWGGSNLLLSGDYALNQVHRLPAGMRYLGAEIAITGQREVLYVEMATSPQELRNG